MSVGSVMTFPLLFLLLVICDFALDQPKYRFINFTDIFKNKHNMYDFLSFKCIEISFMIAHTV